MIPLPTVPKIVKKEANTAVFEIEALYPGYGATVGNSLRRVLFSSLQGAAATQMKIKGVSHEFSTIPGVMEDVISIMLNLKNLRFRIFSDEAQTGRIHVKGEKEVKGSDLELPTQVELINKDAHIATLTSKSADFDMEITIEKGIGYSPREERKKAKMEIGVVPLDAIFAPVKKVSFKVENMRVGERTDFDKLTLELETDGSITPESAFFQASDILVQHFSLLTETFRQAAIAKAPEPKTIKSKKTAPKKKSVSKKKKK